MSVAETQPIQTAVAIPPQPTLYHSPDAERFAMEQRMARVFVESGLFNDVKGSTPQQAIAQAYVKIALGNSMGFSPAESMQGIDLIQGRPAISAQLRAARMQRAGFSWAPTSTDRGCWLALMQAGRPIMVPRVDTSTGLIMRDREGSPLLEQATVSYTEEDAKKAGLLGKDNWKKDPSSMYFARAITRAQRRFAPGVLSGDILTREEAFDADPDAFGPAHISEPLREPQSLAGGDALTVTAEAKTDNPAATEPAIDKARAQWIEKFDTMEKNLGTDEFMRRLGAGPDSYGAVDDILTSKMPAEFGRMEKA